MAKENDVDERKDRQQADSGAASADASKKRSGGLLPWIITAGVAVLCACAGIGLGRLFGPTATSDTGESGQQAGPVSAQLMKGDGSQTDSEKGWYFDLEPVVANLDEPGATRYVRAALTLEISSELDQKKTTAFVQERSPLLKNWLTIYLASQTIDDMRGDRNLRRIQLEILDTFNEKLFPDATPPIQRVLFKEFAIQ
jgi:flagellar FliL protein